jgi:hypothetical protein
MPSLACFHGPAWAANPPNNNRHSQQPQPTATESSAPLVHHLGDHPVSGGAALNAASADALAALIGGPALVAAASGQSSVVPAGAQVSGGSRVSKASQRKEWDKLCLLAICSVGYTDASAALTFPRHLAGCHSRRHSCRWRPFDSCRKGQRGARRKGSQGRCGGTGG